MQKTKVTIKNILIGAIAIVALFSIPQSVSAGSTSWDFSGGDYLYDSQPSYGYDSSPSYGYDYSSPSYGYDYTPSYNYAYDTPSYSYTPSASTPSYTYQYAAPAKTTSKATSNANAKSYSYVYSNNENKLTNTSSNTNNNSNTNVNNVNVVVYGGGGYSTSTYNQTGGTQNPQLDGNCYISPSQARRGQDVSFQASATGGNGSYTYQWSGSEGLSAYSQSFTGRFYSTGNKIVYVHITSGNQSITRTCNVNVIDDIINNNNLSAYCVGEPQTVYVGQNVTWRVNVSGNNNSYYNDPYYNNNNYGYTYNWTGTEGLYGTTNVVYRTYSTTGLKYAYVSVYTNGQTVNAQCSVNVVGSSVVGTTYVPPTTGTPVSGVFLSQLPATGIDDMLAFKNILITSAVIIWAAFMAYIVAQKRKRNHIAHTRDKAEAFKLANLEKRNG